MLSGRVLGGCGESVVSFDGAVAEGLSFLAADLFLLGNLSFLAADLFLLGNLSFRAADLFLLGNLHERSLIFYREWPWDRSRD